jgi:hypothetical protein
MTAEAVAGAEEVGVTPQDTGEDKKLAAPMRAPRRAARRPIRLGILVKVYSSVAYSSLFASRRGRYLASVKRAVEFK